MSKKLPSNINVAVAGVTKGLGRHITTSLLNNSKFTVTVLSRAPATPISQAVIDAFASRGAIIKLVDYSSIPTLASALAGVHTLISTVWDPDDHTSMRNLFHAAVEASVKRLAPSEFSLSKAANDSIDGYRWRNKLMAEMKESGLECTAFRSGIFMDFLAAGSPVSYEGHRDIGPYVVDVAARKAEIVGTGDEPITLTTAEDVGRFVAAAVELDNWPEEMGMEGERTTYNNVVKEAEEVLGEKFTVTYVKVEDLKGILSGIGEDSTNPLMKLAMQGLLAISEGKAAVEPYLNRVTDVKPMTLKEFLKKYWGKEQLASTTSEVTSS